MSYRVVFLALLLAGCGQKGNLYLPQKAPVPSTRPVPAEAAESAEKREAPSIPAVPATQP